MQGNVLDYLYDIVKEKPQKTAFTDGSAELTFEEVYLHSRAVGSFLNNMDVYNKAVVVFMRKSPMEIAAFFGVVAGGCFYVPIDEEMPAARIGMILENVCAPVIICDNDTFVIAEGFGRDDAEIVLYDDIIHTRINDGALERIYNKAIDIDPIYIVFTSGSTGVPKGVAACHRSVIDYVEQLSDTLGFDENTVFGNQTPLYFDACLKEIYPTVKFGATTYLIPHNLFSFPVNLVEYLNENHINTICWVVSALTMISSLGTFDSVKPEFLHTIAFGSEVFPIKQFKIWKETLPDASFTNLYGPTEGTGMCCYYKVDRDFENGETIPIGRPFPNCAILLLTEDGREADKGEEGEICIRGTAVTLGYYNDFERTGRSFVQNPLNKAYPEIIYRTGDIGRMNDAGELMFVSRKDYQIKHMGHRIELGEIEVNVNMLQGISMSACVYDMRRGKIVLCYTGEMCEKELMAGLKAALPRYMLPNRVFKLDNMPLMANGKVNRVLLRENYAQ